MISNIILLVLSFLFNLFFKVSSSIIIISKGFTPSFIYKLFIPYNEKITMYPFISFLIMCFIIISFFIFWGLILEKRGSIQSTSFLTTYFQKVQHLITPVRYISFLTIFIILALILQFYFSAFIFCLILLNLIKKIKYIPSLIYIVIFLRLLWFFSPYSEIVSMTVPYRSFTCVFSLCGYVFFLKYHKYVILWIGTLFRICLGIGIEDGIVYSMYTFKLNMPHSPSHTPPTTPPTSPRNVHTFFDTLDDHKQAATSSNIRYFNQPSEIFSESIIKPFEQVYFGNETPSVKDEFNFLRFKGTQGRILSNYDKAAALLEKDKVVKSWDEDGYWKEHQRVSNELNLVGPEKILATVDFPLAQENEEFIAIKGFCHSRFPGEHIKISRGSKKFDFTLTRENGERIFIDVTSPSTKLTNFEKSYIQEKLEKLPIRKKKGESSLLLLYNFSENSPAFLGAPKLFDRVSVLKNSEIQNLLDSYNVDIDFLEPQEKTYSRKTVFNKNKPTTCLILPREEAYNNLKKNLEGNLW